MSYRKTIFQDDMMHILSDDDNLSYHEVEVQSQTDGELESVTIDKSTGKILIRFKEDKREKETDENENYIKPLGKDKDFKINIVEK